MKTQIKLSDAVGRTMTGSANSPYTGHMVLLFGDHYVHLGVNRGYDGDVAIEECPLDPFSFDNEQLILHGIYSYDEIQALHAERRVKQQRLREIRDRRRLDLETSIAELEQTLARIDERTLFNDTLVELNSAMLYRRKLADLRGRLESLVLLDEK